MTPTFSDAVRVWARIALQSFGGPAGQISVIHRVVVEEKRWVDEPRFLHALGYCMLLPGPEAQQLATYFGWLMHGTRGALVAGGLFVLPGALAILALSYLYVTLGQTPLVAGLFAGLKPAVLAVVLTAVTRLGSRALPTPAAVILAGLAFLALFAFNLPFPIVVVGAGLLGLFVKNNLVQMGQHPRPSLLPLIRTLLVGIAIWSLPLVILFLAGGRNHVLAREAKFFGQVAVVTFGGAYAVLAYVAQQAVEVYHWLTPAEMLDGLGLAETTPGPLIMVLQFVGFLGAYRSPGTLDPLLAGVLGSLVTTWVTFVPSFVFILAGAPWVEYLAGNRRIKAVLAGIMAAVVGVVLNLGVWFGIHTLFGAMQTIRAGPLVLLWPEITTVQWVPAGITFASWVALVRFKVPLGVVLAAAALIGAITGP